VRTGALDPSITTFEIHVPKAFPGAIVRRLAEARTNESVTEAFLAARQLHWGDAPDFQKRGNVAETLQSQINELFATNAGARAFQRIIPRFQLTVANKTAMEELRSHLADTIGIVPGVLEQVLNHYYGWVTKMVQERIELTGHAPIISFEEAFKEFHTFYQSIAMGGSLPDSASAPTPDDYARLLNYPFIRQLDLIQGDSSTKKFAMTVFFKASSARTKWVEHDHLREESIQELNETLMQAYRDNQAIAAASGGGSEVCGRNLLARCHQHRCRVALKEPPPYFIPGCFHVLADNLQLGWHPDYFSLLGVLA
jgi:hypothetical protein